MKVVIASFAALVRAVASYLPPGIMLSLSAAFISNGEYFSSWMDEFVGSLLMIACTFSAGKWIGADSLPVAWASHAVGVIAADYFGGGPQVNPAVSLSMWSLGKISYTEFFVKVCGQMMGGMVAFPLFQYVAHTTLGLNELGGPEFQATDDDEAVGAFLSEFFASVLLMFLIYAVNWELNFGKYHYIIKQTLTAVGIRFLIEVFPTAGPAMNPMLGTAWAVFAAYKKTGSTHYPEDPMHYFIYWLAPFCAALVASFAYSVFDGTPFFGKKLSIGPIKPSTAPAPTETATKTKKATKKE
eukprot:scaffold8884_cov44-Attheya_sp.AAC.2